MRRKRVPRRRGAGLVWPPRALSLPPTPACLTGAAPSAWRRHGLIYRVCRGGFDPRVAMAAPMKKRELRQKLRDDENPVSSSSEDEEYEIANDQVSDLYRTRRAVNLTRRARGRARLPRALVSFLARRFFRHLLVSNIFHVNSSSLVYHVSKIIVEVVACECKLCSIVIPA